MERSFPFTAIVNQEAMKRALVLNTVNPAVGGVLIRGERGTAKSTAVRALADVLPDIDVVADCPFECPPDDPERMCQDCQQRHTAGEDLPVDHRPMRVVDLPLNASEDRVVGTIDFEQAVQSGRRSFEPGILADANRHILYVDEVNLLDDHIVDVLLDAAAMGENVVEREGVSYRHPANFILVGTMNPEEGDLRPQLLDRFGLVVNVAGSDDIAERAEVAARRETFEADPDGFRRQYADAQRDLRDRIVAGRERLPDVTVPGDVRSSVSYEALKQRAYGLRADIAVDRIARAIAAVEGNETVTEAHAREAQYFAFPHRVEGMPERELGSTVFREEAEGDQEQDDEGNESEPTENDGENDGGGGGIPIAEGEDSYPVDRTAIDPPTDRLRRDRFGRRTRSRIDGRSGRYVRSRDAEDVTDVALDATIRAAAPHQTDRGDGDSVTIEPRDLHEKLRERETETLLVFVVDASGSVMSGRQMLETKRGILSLVDDAYRTRDRVAVVAFRGEGAFTLIEPTPHISRARQAVSNLQVGGNTPLAHGLVTAYELVQREKRRDEQLYPLVVVFSDGQTNVAYREDGDAREDALEAASLFADDQIPAVYLDTGYRIDMTPDDVFTERKAERIKEKRREKNLRLAEAMGADYLPLVQLPRNDTLPEEEVTET